MHTITNDKRNLIICGEITDGIKLIDRISEYDFIFVDNICQNDREIDKKYIKELEDKVIHAKKVSNHESIIAILTEWDSYLKVKSVANKILGKANYRNTVCVNEGVFSLESKGNSEKVNCLILYSSNKDCELIMCPATIGKVKDKILLTNEGDVCVNISEVLNNVYSKTLCTNNHYNEITTGMVLIDLFVNLNSRICHIDAKNNKLMKAILLLNNIDNGQRNVTTITSEGDKIYRSIRDSFRENRDKVNENISLIILE